MISQVLIRANLECAGRSATGPAEARSGGGNLVDVGVLAAAAERVHAEVEPAETQPGAAKERPLRRRPR